MPFFDLLLCKSSKGTLSEADILIEESRIESLLSFKLLLLGAGESGKSTILRQFKLVNKITFTQEEKKKFRH
jgi:guanine nucleotide-binding protein G(i) subunit alpha